MANQFPPSDFFVRPQSRPNWTPGMLPETYSLPFPVDPFAASSRPAMTSGSGVGILGQLPQPTDAWDANNSGLFGGAFASHPAVGLFDQFTQPPDAAGNKDWRPGIQFAGDITPRTFRPWESGQAGIGLGGGAVGFGLGSTAGGRGSFGPGGSVAESQPMAAADSAGTQAGGYAWPSRPGIYFPPDVIPGTPEWWEHAKRGHQGLWDFLTHLPRRINPGLWGERDEECRKEWQEARKACAEAFANGWRGDYGSGPYGPYKKRGDAQSDYDDCVRGRVSQRCGGNRVD
jgi:hypothetical protein